MKKIIIIIFISMFVLIKTSWATETELIKVSVSKVEGPKNEITYVIRVGNAHPERSKNITEYNISGSTRIGFEVSLDHWLKANIKKDSQ